MTAIRPNRSSLVIWLAVNAPQLLKRLADGAADFEVVLPAAAASQVWGSGLRVQGFRYQQGPRTA